MNLAPNAVPARELLRAYALAFMLSLGVTVSYDNYA